MTSKLCCITSRVASNKWILFNQKCLLLRKFQSILLNECPFLQINLKHLTTFVQLKLLNVKAVTTKLCQLNRLDHLKILKLIHFMHNLTELNLMKNCQDKHTEASFNQVIGIHVILWFLE